MLLFWVVAGVLAAVSAALILFRAAGAVASTEAPDPSQILYQRQLAEIDDLVERGLMGEAERKGAHAEAGRRLLTASEAPLQIWVADPRVRGLALLAAVTVPALAAQGESRRPQTQRQSRHQSRLPTGLPNWCYRLWRPQRQEKPSRQMD